MKKIDWLVIILICGVSIFVLRDLFKPGMYTSHDGIHQTVRFYYFDQLVREGQFPPRWVRGLLNGFGYPLFIFSYHMPWFIAEIPRILGASIINSVKMTFLLGFLLSGVTMYFFQKEIFGRFSAMVGTVIYLFAPYRFSNIFVRAAIGDATVFIFPPLLFLAIYRLKSGKNNKKFWIAVGAASLAAMLLSHAMVFLFFFLAFGLYILYSLLFSARKKFTLFYGAAITIIGFGAASYYFIPSLFETGFTKFREIMGNVFVGSTFLNIRELLYSPWGYGVMHAKEGGMSFQLGFAQWLAVISSIPVILYGFFCRKENKIDEKFKDALFFLFIVIFSLFLTLPASLPFWKLLSNFVIVDFTWRILAVTVFAVSFLAGFLVNTVRFPKIIAVILVALALYANRNNIHINKILAWDVPFMLKLEKTTNSYDEYTPKWVKNEYIKENLPRVEFAGAKANAENLIEKSNSIQFSLNAPEAGIARINTIYYPGWNVYLNNKSTKIDYSSGFMDFSVPEGSTTVIARFEETRLRLMSDIVSLMSLVVIVILILSPLKIKLLSVMNKLKDK